MTLRLSCRAEWLTSSLFGDILHLTQRRGMISFAGGLPSAEAMPPLDFAGRPTITVSTAPAKVNARTERDRAKSVRISETEMIQAFEE